MIVKAPSAERPTGQLGRAAQELGHDAWKNHGEAVSVAVDILKAILSTGNAENTKEADIVVAPAKMAQDGYGTMVAVREIVDGDEALYHLKLLAVTRTAGYEEGVSMDAVATVVGFTTKLLWMADEHDGTEDPLAIPLRTWTTERFVTEKGVMGCDPAGEPS